MKDKASPRTSNDAGIVAGPEGRKAQLLKGLAELALLSLLKDRAHYGLEILDQLRAEAGLDLAEGTIYPLLHRLERGALVAAEWRMESDAVARPRKYYQLTDAGRAELVGQSTEWRRIATSLTAFLDRSGA
jgi:PadR family transcriptional regulator PadR